MSAAHEEWQRRNTVEIKLRLSRNRDPEIIAYLESTGAPQQELRRLVRQEILRTGRTKEEK